MELVLKSLQLDDLVRRVKAQNLAVKALAELISQLTRELGWDEISLIRTLVF
jgi:hypothetical protein